MVLIKEKANNIKEKVNKANQVIGLIRRTFKYIDESQLFKTLVRPYLEYANAVVGPSQTRRY